jgi:hypothetical protein
MDEFNVDAMNAYELRKLFTKHSGLNCLNDFTLQDIEDSKKRMFMKYGYGHKDLIERAAQKIIEDKFSLAKTQAVVVKNTVPDNLNANYKNTIQRLIMVDSQYRPDLTKEATDFIVPLNEKIVNAVSLQIMTLQIPYTFYNIEQRRANHVFEVSGVKIALDDGFYTLTNLIPAINQKMVSAGITDISFSTPSATTGKVKVQGPRAFTLNFTPPGTKINTNLGWSLGFQNINGSTVSSSNDAVNLLYQGASMYEGNKVASVPMIKYVSVVVDDFNNSQTADTMVHSRSEQQIAKPSSYFTQEEGLEDLTPDNFAAYTTVPRTLTKSQLFTVAQQNQAKKRLFLQNSRQEVHAPDQILAVFPFDPNLIWGQTLFTDDCKYSREYHGPTSLERLHVQLYDDSGYLLELNGHNWYMTLMTKNLYKY